MRMKRCLCGSCCVDVSVAMIQVVRRCLCGTCCVDVSVAMIQVVTSIEDR